MKKIFKYSVVTVLLTVGMVQSSNAQEKLPQVRETLSDVQSEISKVKPEYERLKDENQLLGRELDNLSERLVIITEKIQISETHIENLEETLKDLDSQEQNLSANLQTKRAETSKVLSAIGRLSLAPKSPLGAVDGETETVQAALVLKSLTHDLKQKADALSKDLKQLSDTREELKKTRADLSNENLSLASDREKLEVLLTERKNRIEENNSGLKKQELYIATLSAKERDIESLINKIQQQEKTLLDEKKQEMLALDKNIQNNAVTNMSTDNTPVQVASLQNNKTYLSDSGGQGGILSPESFDSQRGQLLMPVSGKIMYGFGAKDMTGKSRQGITLRSRGGSVVASPSQGEVIFVGKFRDYGHMVIVKPTENYHILVAGLGSSTVTLGQKIIKGEPIGRMPAGIGQNNLYLEMRKNRTPVNPMPWLRGVQ